MPIRISSAVGVSHRALVKQGAYDGFLDVDSLLFVDPHLLANASTPELATSAQRFTDHFRVVLRLLKASKRVGDLPWKEARKRLTFPEIPHTALGYTKEGTRGRAIGRKLAGQLTSLAKEIVDAGIEDPELFTLLGLLQEGVGPDLISDMTVAIIVRDLLAFSQRVALALGVDTEDVSTTDVSLKLPVTKKGRALVLVPAELLRSLPVAYSWDDVDMVASQNAQLRERVNGTIGDTWREATSRSVKKRELRDAVLRHPELMRDLIAQYRAKAADGYDFSKDPAGVQVWFEVAQELSQELPLDLGGFRHPQPDQIYGLVKSICQRFKELVEDNRLGRVLYNDDGSSRKEKTAQLFFFALATFYCEANDLDLSPEADAGAGPVDFKVSRGSRAKVTVEVKLSSNQNLVHGFTEQLPAYSRAERAEHGIFLVVRNGDHTRRLADLEKVRAAAEKAGQRVPEVILVDGRPTPSASKRRPRP